MKILSVSAFISLIFVFTLTILLVSCDPISLKETIEDMILGWTRAVTLTSPGNDAGVAEKTPLLDWEDAGGATGYQVQISDTDSFDGITSMEIEEAVSQCEIPGIGNGIAVIDILDPTSLTLIGYVEYEGGGWFEVFGNYIVCPDHSSATCISSIFCRMVEYP